MPVIFRFFWFFCAAFMAINVVIWRRRLATLVSRGAAAQPEVDRFLRWTAAWLVGGPLVVGLIGLAAGWSSPFCAGFLAFDSVPRLLTSVVLLTSWFALLFWVWRGRGAEFLARVGPVLGIPSYSKTYSPGMVRAYITILLIISSVGAGMAWRSMRFPPDMACPGAIADR